MHALPVNRRTRLIDHDNRQRAIGDPRVAAQSTGELLAMFDRATGGCKFEACPVSRRSVVPHIEIIGPHRGPCSGCSGRMDCGAARQSIPASESYAEIRDSQGAGFRKSTGEPSGVSANFATTPGCIIPIYSNSAKAPPLSGQFGLLWVTFLGILSSTSGSARSISRRAIRSIKVAVVSPRLSASIAAVSTFLARPSRLLRNAITVPLSEGAR